MTHRRLLVAAGLAAMIGLFAWLGARAIGADIWRAAWTVPFCLAIHAVQLLLSALAWRGVSGGPPPDRPAWWRARWVREAVNSMLPVAQMGGNLVGVRLLAARGAGQARAAAGTVLDLTVEAATEAVFVLAGLATLAAISRDRSWLGWLGGGAAFTCLGAAAFVAAQRLGLLRLIERAAGRLRRYAPRLNLRGLQSAFAERQRDIPALARATALHMAAWLLGVAETWLVLAAMGQGHSLSAAFVIESLGVAARSAGFAIPGSLGVQEAGFVLVASFVAVPAGAAVALSMVKRARELTVGVGGLLAWQGSEGFWFWRREPAQAATRSEGEHP